MSKFKNVLEILNLLEKSNCRKCNYPTCMVFAAKVFKGERKIIECPYISNEVVKKYNNHEKKSVENQNDLENKVKLLKNKIGQMELSTAAIRVSGEYKNGKLTISILGKRFSIDQEGNLYSDIHANLWVTIPIFSYILQCQGVPLTNNWVTMREIPSGKKWHHFFEYQCIKPLKKVADQYTDLFKDMVDIFSGKRTNHHYQADITVVLKPLPLVPIMICYWQLEDEMESDLKIFFDTSAEQNIGAEGLYSLGVGILRMFEKLALRHGF